MAKKKKTSQIEKGFLSNARCYLSGPMDFVASRAEEKRTGWRVRIAEFLRTMGVTVFDPWYKPRVRGLHEYGKEDVKTTQVRHDWTFEPSASGRTARRTCASTFRETMHMDLRMVDLSDFVIAYCPTNIYSVGTPHEIIVARLQHKPVLFVSPPVEFPHLKQLERHLRRQKDKEGLKLLRGVRKEVPIKPNPQGVPSLWYMPLVGGENFFDGFGFDLYRDQFAWDPTSPTDQRETKIPPQRPLLPFLDTLNDREKLPQRYSKSMKKHIPDDDWLLLDLEHEAENA